MLSLQAGAGRDCRAPWWLSSLSQETRCLTEPEQLRGVRRWALGPSAVENWELRLQVPLPRGDNLVLPKEGSLSA